MRIRLAVGALLVGSALLVGCGDGDDDTASGSSVTDSTTGGNTSGSGDGATIDQARCVGAATAMAQAAAAVPQALAGTSTAAQASVEQFAAFADAAPSEIKEDLQTVADGYKTFARVLAETNYNPASGQAAPPAVVDATEDLEDSDFQEAATRVNAWFQAGCKS